MLSFNVHTFPRKYTIDRMSKTGRSAQVSQLFGVGLTGIGIGWLTGMSTSPVLGLVLTSVLAVVTGIITALAGIERPAAGESRRLSIHPNAWPAAVLVIAVICGSVIGIHMRVNESLGTGPAEIAHKWQSAGLRLNTDVIIRRLFEEEHGNVAPLSPGDKPGAESKTKDDGKAATGPQARGPYFFSTDENICKTLRARDGAILMYEMQHSGIATVEAFAKRVDNPRILKVAVETLICPESSPSQ